MFRFRWWMAGLGALAIVLTPAAAADLSKIERTIRKEPKYQGKPKYALLVFGPEVKVRVWVVEDGDTLYVDCNGDGDLTSKDERFTREFPNSTRWNWNCNIEIHDPDKRTRYLITSIGTYAENDKPDAEQHLMANVDIKGRIDYRQYCDAKLGASPDKADVAHYHGPLMIEPKRSFWKLTPELSHLPIGDSPGDINALVGTMDAERGCWVVVRSEDLPKELHPVVEVEYPASKAGDSSIKKRYPLKERC